MSDQSTGKLKVDRKEKTRMWISRKKWQELKMKVNALESKVDNHQKLWDLFISQQKEYTRTNRLHLRT